jgi:NitT/TauT family transport system permease protein
MTAAPAKRTKAASMLADQQMAQEGSGLTIGLVTLGIFIALGEIIPRSGIVSRVVLPTGGDVAAGFWRLVSGGYWLGHLETTMTAVAIAWVVGSTIGLVVGISMGISAFVRKVVKPYVIAFQALPKIVLAPLFIGWLGFGTKSKVAIAVVICFFPVWVDTMVGLSLPTAREFTFLRALRASRWQVFRMLQLPTALPLIMVGLKHAVLLAFTGVLVAEILAASAGGLGVLAEQYAVQLLMPLTFSVILVVVVIAVTLTTVLDWVEHRVVFWSEGARARADATRARKEGRAK